MKKIFLSHTSSTMQAMEEILAESSLAEGSLVRTDYQTAGKGQDGNHWESEAGKNLLFTAVYYPVFLDPARQFLLSEMASLAVHHLLCSLLPDHGVHIKWPNDIYIGDRKIAGILLRHSLKGNHLHRSLIGIGLNVNQLAFSPDLPNPVSMHMLTGQTFSMEHTLEDLLREMARLYDALCAGEFATYEQQYEAALYRLNMEASYRIDGRVVPGVIRGVDKLGRLLLEAEGKTKAYGMKEVEYLSSGDDQG
jgi:BirA family biotin operon repressor/biotin-[acetyl-CoA-carboxylase] ligase